MVIAKEVRRAVTTNDANGIAPNTLGMFAVEDTEPGKIFGQVFRVKPAPVVGFDFIMPGRVR